MKIKIKRASWVTALVVLAALVAMPTFHVRAQGGAGFTKIASPTATTYTDTACPKAQTCQYEVTAVNSSGESTPDGPISVLNNGSIGNIVLTWSAGSCPTGKSCGTPTSYNVYGLYPTVPPAGLAGVSQ